MPSNEALHGVSASATDAALASSLREQGGQAERGRDERASVERRSTFEMLKLAVQFSLREMRGGLSGFLIFLTCIALGVAAIGGVNSVARSISAGVANEGQSLLGGDLRFELVQREANAAEKAFLESLGAVAETASMRSMARLPDGSDQALVELKAVEAAYPLYGTLAMTPALPISCAGTPHRCAATSMRSPPRPTGDNSRRPLSSW